MSLSGEQSIQYRNFDTCIDLWKEFAEQEKIALVSIKIDVPESE